MDHDVFISYATPDREVADAVCRHLEANGLRCWINTKNIGGGDEWPMEIAQGVASAKLMVLVFSSRADASMHVMREMSLACHNREIPIIPFRVEDVQPNKLQYFLQMSQWINAFPRPAEHLDRLTSAVKRKLSPGAAEDGTGSSGTAGDAQPAASPAEIVAAMAAAASSCGAGCGAAAPVASQRVVIVYKRGPRDDEYVLRLLESRLRARGHDVFIDRHMRIGEEWAREIVSRIKAADAVVVLLSDLAVQSEMVEQEVQVAHDEGRLRAGKPRILPVRVRFTGPLSDALRAVLAPLQYFLWEGQEQDDRLVREIEAAMTAKGPAPTRAVEPVGGAMPLDTRYYVDRPTDALMHEAVGRQDPIVLVKGARQMGKTSLLARGLERARRDGKRVALVDLQSLNADELASPVAFYKAVGGLLADELELDIRPAQKWDDTRSPNNNFERFVTREVLAASDAPLVWALDEVDRLFSTPFQDEVFGLFRTWYNNRANKPHGPWQKLTLGIVYATEAHLFITNLSQSPFNVGTLVDFQDFTPEQVGEVNERYDRRLGPAELRRFYGMVGGQPFLVRRGMNELAKSGVSLADLEARADKDDGPFGDHLKRILVTMKRDADIGGIVRGMLADPPRPPPTEAFFRLRSGGLLAGGSAIDARFRCPLYERFLRRHMISGEHAPAAASHGPPPLPVPSA